MNKEKRIEELERTLSYTAHLMIDLSKEPSICAQYMAVRQILGLAIHQDHCAILSADNEPCNCRASTDSLNANTWDTRSDHETLQVLEDAEKKLYREELCRKLIAFHYGEPKDVECDWEHLGIVRMSFVRKTDGLQLRFGGDDGYLFVWISVDGKATAISDGGEGILYEMTDNHWIAIENLLEMFEDVGSQGDGAADPPVVVNEEAAIASEGD